MINRLSRITKLQRMKKKKNKSFLSFFFLKNYANSFELPMCYSMEEEEEMRTGDTPETKEGRTCDTVLAIARKRWCFRKSKAGQPLTCGHPPDLHTIHLSLSLLLPSIFRSVGRAGARSEKLKKPKPKNK